MPLYDFRCTKCGMEFEVSRPLSKASEPALCPLDGSECERVFTMPGTFVKGGSARDSGEVPQPPGQGGNTWSHFGHSHGPGSGGHSHDF
jgi:putative FmdB family regulatory protein